jgi:hypothetical protein
MTAPPLSRATINQMLTPRVERDQATAQVDNAVSLDRAVALHSTTSLASRTGEPGWPSRGRGSGDTKTSGGALNRYRSSARRFSRSRWNCATWRHMGRPRMTSTAASTTSAMRAQADHGGEAYREVTQVRWVDGL